LRCCTVRARTSLTIPTSIASCRAAGPSLDGTRWVSCRAPASSCRCASWRACFAGCFEHLRAAYEAGRLHFFADIADLTEPATFANRLAAVCQLDWVVYAKPPFGGQQVLSYLGRYTRRVAIANSRLLSLSDGQVTFRWRDYRHRSKTKLMTLPAHEFIRRFLLHTLPDGFHRIRHYRSRSQHSRLASMKAGLPRLNPRNWPRQFHPLHGAAALGEPCLS
jgi:hypothetical protein